MVSIRGMKKRPKGPLARYLAEAKVSAVDFAALIGVKHPTVSRYCHGRIPEPEMMRKIAVATGNRVTPNDWLGITSQPDQAVTQ